MRWHGAQQRTAGRLRGEVVGQRIARQQGLEVVREQERLGALAAVVVVHDAALEAQVNEVVVVRVLRGCAGRQAPQLEVEQRQQASVGITLRKGVRQADRRVKRGQEFDRLAI